MSTAVGTSSSGIQTVFNIHGFYSRESCGYCKRGNSSSYGASCPFGSHVLSKDYEKLMLIGWRRCGTFFYKPNMPYTCCPQYTIRLNANEFKPSKSQKKVLSRMNKYCQENSVEITVETRKAMFTDEIFELYKRYQVKVHQDPPEKLSVKGFRSFLVDSPLYDDRTSVPKGSLEWGTFHQLYRLGGKLVAVGVLDFSESGLSSVYCFYDPDLPQLSLGKYTALREIEFVKSNSLPYYFLGFYIHTCPKMSYKSEYKPAELLCPTSLQWYSYEKCVEYLDQFSFTPFEATLASRRKEVEILVNKLKEEQNRRKEVDRKVYYDDVGEASHKKEMDDLISNENNDDDNDDDNDANASDFGDDYDGGSGDEMQNDVKELFKEFLPIFHSSSSDASRAGTTVNDKNNRIDDIPIKLRGDQIATFSDITPDGQKVLKPLLEDWMAVCPPDIVTRIHLAF